MQLHYYLNTQSILYAIVSTHLFCVNLYKFHFGAFIESVI